MSTEIQGSADCMICSIHFFKYSAIILLLSPDQLINIFIVYYLIFLFAVGSCYIATNARLYAVGRGFSARYESFRPNAVKWGGRNQQYAVEPRLPYTALLGAGLIWVIEFFYN